ncbi:MAG TPA: hypothetical protein VKR06_46280 [Ktedonosporobacter sp.]|nr:hypothetical protein [Ktedonosporobacter sp.]
MAKISEQRKPVHKRRTEEEMRGALSALVTGKERKPDDEWDVVLDDTITEVITTRALLIDLTQKLAIIQQDMTAGVKNIFTS